MFAARALGVSAAIFLLLYVALSLAVSKAWHLLTRVLAVRSAKRLADTLFAIRTSPFALAAVFTLGVALPSFWLLESHTSYEPLGLATLVLGACCLLILSLGLARVILAHRRTSRAIAGWLQGSSLLKLDFGSLTHQASVFFTLRTFPFVLALLFTVGFTLPSYLLLDPRATDKGICLFPLVLGAGGLLIMSVGLARAVLAQGKTARAMTGWLQESSLPSSEEIVRVFQTGPGAPTLTVAGISEPKVLVSEAAIATLSEAELRSALRHEIAHIHSYDNLKKMLFRFLVFPGMSSLERAWSETAEIAADDAAVSSACEALDLASALIKVSRLAPVKQAELTTGLLHGSTALSARIERLFAWGNRSDSESSLTWWCMIPPALDVVACIIVFYSSMLVHVHKITEWLIR